MKTTPRNRTIEELKDLQAVAGNGLLHRRAFLRGGAALAAAMTGYTMVEISIRRAARGRSVEHEPGALVPPYAVPSRFEKNVVRTLSNPKGEPRTQHARTPHHLLNGTITPNGLHFVISHAGDARHRSGEAPPGDPRSGEAAAGLHARCACALSDGVAHGVRRMRRQQRAAVLERADAGQRAGAARPGLVRRVDRRACSRRCSKRPASTRRRNG